MKAYTINAFVSNGNGGNPAGVVLGADTLTAQQKQQIAATMGLSETAFVSRSKQQDYIVDFFTPNKQIALCGHATVGTFGFMKQSGLLNKDKLVIKTGVGDIGVFIKNGQVYMEQPAPTYTTVTEDASFLAHSLGLSISQINPQPVIAGAGTHYVLIEVPDEKTLAQIVPNHSEIELYSEKQDLIGYYVYTRQTNNADATARMFASRYQIPEESATGVGAALLASYLFDYGITNKQELIIHQGFFMPVPSPSKIHAVLNIEEGKLKSVQVGGESKLMGEREIEL